MTTSSNKGSVRYPNSISDARALGIKLGHASAVRDVIAVVDEYISSVKIYKDERHDGAFVALTRLRKRIVRVGKK